MKTINLAGIGGGTAVVAVVAGVNHEFVANNVQTSVLAVVLAAFSVYSCLTFERRVLVQGAMLGAVAVVIMIAMGLWILYQWQTR